MSAVPRASQILLVGQRIRQLRKSRHLTQADLASRIGITQSDLSRMESGEYKVGLDTLFKILHVFELSMSRFFEEAPEVHEAQDAHDAAEAGDELPEKEQLLADLAELSDDSRREVREFIAFKRQQAERSEAKKPKWPAPTRDIAARLEAGESVDSEASIETVASAETLAIPGNEDGEVS